MTEIDGVELVEGESPTEDPRFVAGMEFLRRTGATELQIGHSDQEAQQMIREGKKREAAESNGFGRHAPTAGRHPAPRATGSIAQAATNPVNAHAWHVAPRSARDSILQHGLDAAQRSEPDWRDDYPWANAKIDPGAAPQGQFLWTNWNEAVNQHELASETAPHDIWHVDVTGLQLGEDPWQQVSDFSAYPHARYQADPIPPDRLTLLEEPHAYNSPRTSAT